MKKYLFASLSTLLLLAAIPLVISGFTLIAAIVCIAAFFTAFKGVEKFTNLLDFGVIFFSVLMLGFVLDFPSGKFPFMTLAMFFLGTSLCTRFLLIWVINYNRYPWIESATMVCALFFYVYGNIANHLGWMGWAFPVISLVLGIWNAVGAIMESKLSKKIIKHGYQVQIGKPAPEFELPDQDGNLVKLSDFKNQRDLLLIFVRGDWCPSCHIMLRTYERNREKFSKKNVMVFAIGPDPVGVNRDMVKRLGIEYKVLSDEKQNAVKLYGIHISDKIPGNKYEEGLPMPAAFLIDKKGIVRYTTRPDRVGEFLDPTTVFPILESLN